MRGTIAQISTKTGTSSRGPWKRWGIKIGETWYSTLDPEIGKHLKEGQTYDFTIEEKGQYLTITEAIPIGSAPAKEEAPFPVEGAKSVPALTTPPEAPKQPATAPKVAQNYNGREEAINKAHQENMKATAWQVASRLSINREFEAVKAFAERVLKDITGL